MDVELFSLLLLYRMKIKTENMKKYMFDYRRSDRGSKAEHKARWRFNGMIFDNQFENVYRDYITQTNCECCYRPFDNLNKKTLDHDHNITNKYNIRGIICHSCNHRRIDKEWSNSTGERHIFYNYTGNLYDFKLFVDNEKIVSKYFKTLYDACKYRDKWLKANPWVYT